MHSKEFDPATTIAVSKLEPGPLKTTKVGVSVGGTGVSVGVAVGVKVGVKVGVGVSVAVGVGVIVGSNNCPGPQAETSRLTSRQTMMNVLAFFRKPPYINI